MQCLTECLIQTVRVFLENEMEIEQENLLFVKKIKGMLDKTKSR